jgi:hypothetical protein
MPFGRAAAGLRAAFVRDAAAFEAFVRFSARARVVFVEDFDRTFVGRFACRAMA